MMKRWDGGDAAGSWGAEALIRRSYARLRRGRSARRWRQASLVSNFSLAVDSEESLYVNVEGKGEGLAAPADRSHYCQPHGT